jgi:hypothetical protein
VTNCLVGKRPEASRQLGWGDSNSATAVSSSRGQEAVGQVTCGFADRLVSARARCCPRFTGRLRTQHGPTGSRSRLVADASGARSSSRPGTGSAGPDRCREQQATDRSPTPTSDTPQDLLHPACLIYHKSYEIGDHQYQPTLLILTSSHRAAGVGSLVPRWIVAIAGGGIEP